AQHGEGQAGGGAGSVGRVAGNRVGGGPRSVTPCPPPASQPMQRNCGSNSMASADAVERCVQAFGERDYEGCTRQALALLTTGATHTLLQLLLMSLQPLGQAERAEQLGAQALTLTAQQPWETTLLLLTLNRVDQDQVFR